MMPSDSLPGGFGYLEFSRALVILGAAFALLNVLCILAGDRLRDRRFVLAARRALLATGLATAGAALGLVAGFVNGAYERSYIFNYSERGLPLAYKIAGLWGGLDGSILFWAMLVGVAGALVVLGFRRDEKDRDGRRLEPWVYLVFGVVQLFFLVVVAFLTNPFEHIAHSPMFAGHSGDLSGVQAFNQRFPDGVVPDGSGLTPLLVNYWMLIHPPCLYFGWVVYTVPFAFAIAALITGEQGNTWIARIRRWTMVGWLFNTTGIILGGLWAYVVLGWGGYWAWDPVENASFLPWFASTALLHSIMVQERRGMLRTWNALLATLTFVLSIFGTYLTRSGIVQSQHAFGDNPVVGNTFLGFLLLTIATCLFLIALRLPAMRSPHRVESLWSREAMFVINNFVLLATASSILILTIWPVISRGVIGSPITVGAEVYNRVTIPFFVLLLVITALGPALGWIRTSPGTLRRNLLLPAIAALPVAVAIQWGAEAIRAGETGDLEWSKRLYPTFIVIYAACLIVAALGYEVVRTAANRSRRTSGGFVDSLATLILRNHRRYGGYVVHVGFAVIAIGIVCSSMYRVERNVQMKVPDPRHESLPQFDVAGLLAAPPRSGPVLLRGVVERVEAPAVESDATRTRLHLRDRAGGRPSVAVDARMRSRAVSSGRDVYAVGVWDAEQGVLVASQLGHWHPSEFEVGRYDIALARAIDEPDRHVYARTALELEVVPATGASFILHPEKRSYPKKEQVVTEVEIHRGLAEDLYVFFQSAGVDPLDGRPIYGLTFFRNPLILGVWAGWILMILGGVYAALPMGRKRVGLAD